jgi:thiol-disulfide isomerase/thioredoxin
MKNKLFIALVAAAVLLPGKLLFAADTGDATTELKDLVTKVRADLAAGKKTKSALADDLKQFDALLAEHKGEKTDAVARILYMKAMLYAQVLDDQTTADKLLKQLKTEFKGTTLVTQLEEQEAAEAAAKKVQATLVEGAKFPDFDVTSVDGKPLSIASHKGKVVLVDFWATWCPPCRAEIPNVVKIYQQYHDKGFDIIGVSLDQDKDKLLNFTKEQKMTWPQYFDGQGWSNKLAVKYGVESIPATFLLDGDGKIIAKDLRGEALEDAVSKALDKN